MNFSIRPAAQEDVPAMHRLRLSVRANRLADAAKVTERCYLPYVDAGAAWVAERNGEILGFAALDAGRASLWALFVAPEAEGEGVGGALHRRVICQAAKSGIARLSLTTSPGTRAEAFYRKRGWIAAGATADGEVGLERDTSA